VRKLHLCFTEKNVVLNPAHEINVCKYCEMRSLY